MKTLFFDLETTGFRSSDEILSIAIVDEYGTVLLDTLVKPEQKTEWPEAEKVNHISYEMVANAPTMTEIREELNAIFRNANCLISYGISFDYRFIRKWLDEDVLTNLVTDCCLQLAKRSYPDSSHKLCDMMERLGLKWSGNAHTALPDTIACKDVWNAINERK